MMLPQCPAPCALPLPCPHLLHHALLQAVEPAAVVVVGIQGAVQTIVHGALVGALQDRGVGWGGVRRVHRGEGRRAGGCPAGMGWKNRGPWRKLRWPRCRRANGSQGVSPGCKDKVS